MDAFDARAHLEVLAIVGTGLAYWRDGPGLADARSLRPFELCPI